MAARGREKKQNVRRARGSPAGGSGEEWQGQWGGRQTWLRRPPPPQTPGQVGEKIMGTLGGRGESRREKAVREAAEERSETGEMTQRHRTAVGARTQKLNSKERGGLE